MKTNPKPPKPTARKRPANGAAQLKPHQFKEGQSGNPAGPKPGRQREIAEVRQLARNLCPEAIERLGWWLYNAPKASQSMHAADLLLKYGIGLPATPTGAENGGLVVTIRQIDRSEYGAPRDITPAQLGAPVVSGAAMGISASGREAGDSDLSSPLG